MSLSSQIKVTYILILAVDEIFPLFQTLNELCVIMLTRG